MLRNYLEIVKVPQKVTFQPIFKVLSTTLCFEYPMDLFVFAKSLEKIDSWQTTAMLL